MFPPPAYGERRSIPSNSNPMFPPRPQAAPMQRSSIPGHGNPQFPPPPSVRREASEGYYPNGPPPPSYNSGQYPGYGGGGDPSRQVRSMSINAGQFMRPQARHPQPVGAPGLGPVAPGGLPSLANRSVLPRATPGPTMGQPRDGRSHTLDMGLFADARRRKMNFQDILASTSSSSGPAGHHQLPVSRPMSSVGMVESVGQHHHSVGNSENVYPNAIPAYAAAPGQKSFERPHIIGPPQPGCPRCGMRLGMCGCGPVDDRQPQRRIV